MSIQHSKPTEESTTDSTMNRFRLPDSTPEQLNWLDEQPNFMEVEKEKRVKTYNADADRRTRWPKTFKTVTETVYVNPDYEETGRACYGSQQEVADAWGEMKFPSHRWESIGRSPRLHGAYSYTWSSTGSAWGRRPRMGRTTDNESTINFEAVQAPDGRGLIRHYSTITAIRTKTGLVINNEQDFGSGFARVAFPSDSDYTIPLTGVESVISSHPESLFDIVDVETDSRVWSEDPTRVDFASGAAVIIVHDSTANDRNDRKCGFYLDPSEATVLDGAQGGEDSLKPVEVKMAEERGTNVVPADEYAESGAGGFYDDAVLGDAIIRQGEWYLIPMDEGWMPDTPVYKPRSRGENAWQTGHVDLPAEATQTAYNIVQDTFPDRCPDCEGTSLSVAAELPIVSCDACGTLVCYDEEEDARKRAENRTDWLKSEYGDLYEEALGTLDSHKPRDLAVTDDGIYVRGTMRHIRNEHKMLNLKDRWHLAVENTRDVTVFDLGEDGNGVARYE